MPTATIEIYNSSRRSLSDTTLLAVAASGRYAMVTEAGQHFRARRCGARFLPGFRITTGCRSRYVGTGGRGPASAAHHGRWREPRGRLQTRAVALGRSRAGKMHAGVHGFNEPLRWRGRIRGCRRRRRTYSYGMRPRRMISCSISARRRSSASRPTITNAGALHEDLTGWSYRHSRRCDRLRRRTENPNLC